MIFPFLLPQSKRLGAIFHNLTMRRIISESSLVLWTVRSEQTGLGISASLAFITGTKKKKKSVQEVCLLALGRSSSSLS